MYESLYNVEDGLNREGFVIPKVSTRPLRREDDCLLDEVDFNELTTDGVVSSEATDDVVSSEAT